MFGYESLDVGEVYIDAVHKYEVNLMNIGEIDAEFSLEENKAYSRFKFTPDTGKLKVNETVKIRIDFSSSLIGEFHEVHAWKLKVAPSLDCNAECVLCVVV
jgi:hydrocephalus-inducing protein